MLTGRRQCVCADLETHFTFQQSSHLNRREQADGRPTSVLSHACHGDAYVSVGARRGTQLLNVPEPKECRFWAIFGIENWFVRSPSAITYQSGPLIAYTDYTHQALSIDICHPVSSPSITDLDEKRSDRDFSPRSDKTRQVQCMRGARDQVPVLIPSLPFACITLRRYGGRHVLRGRDFCRGLSVFSFFLLCI